MYSLFLAELASFRCNILRYITTGPAPGEEFDNEVNPYNISGDIYYY